MAPRSKCYFLDTPREIRNMIYSKVTRTSVISSHPASTASGSNLSRPIITLEYTISPKVLLVCRQISEEYREHQLPRSELAVVFDGGSEPSLLASFPVSLLKQVRRCSNIILHWARIHEVCGVDQLQQWYHDSHAGEEDKYEEHLPWTPSKG